MAKIAAVMAVFNGAGQLPATLESLAAQTEPDYELIVVDDGSTDGTAALLAGAAERDPRIRVITQPNGGLTRALIRGCAEARAEIIARHDCGDRSHPRRFERQLALLDQNTVVACATRFVGPKGEELYVSRADGDAVRRSLLHDDRSHIRGIPHHASAMFRRADYLAAGGYREQFRYAQDLDLFIRLARRGTFAIPGEVLYEAAIEPSSISSLHRREQERLTEIAIALRDGGAEAALLAEAARVQPSRKAMPRDEAAGLYFIARCLLRQRNPASRSYLLRALRRNPLHWRAWASLLPATALSVHQKLGIKYHLDRHLHYIRRFGLGAWKTRRALWSRGGGVLEVSVPGVAHPVTLRAGSADASTFEHIFVWADYDLAYPTGIRTIIDAGANIGLSAVFFATRFPDATIIAIEPEANNFQLLRRNAAPWPNIIPLQAAVWSSDTTLGLSNPSDRVDSYRFDASAAADTVQAFSLPSLMQKFAIPSVDLLKMDIEGGETAVFAANAEWIDRVGMFIVELHGAEARETFESATARLRGVRYRHGENDIVVVEPGDPV